MRGIIWRSTAPWFGGWTRSGRWLAGGASVMAPRTWLAAVGGEGSGSSTRTTSRHARRRAWAVEAPTARGPRSLAARSRSDAGTDDVAASGRFGTWCGSPLHDGSDAGNDRLMSASPCRTIARGLAQATNEDTVKVAGGGFRENVGVITRAAVSLSGDGTTPDAARVPCPHLGRAACGCRPQAVRTPGKVATARCSSRRPTIRPRRGLPGCARPY